MDAKTLTCRLKEQANYEFKRYAEAKASKDLKIEKLQIEIEELKVENLELKAKINHMVIMEELEKEGQQI